MTSHKFRRKRIGQALGLVVLSLVLLTGSGGYGQTQDQFDWSWLAVTNANGGLSLLNQKISDNPLIIVSIVFDFVVDRLKPTNNPQEKLVRNTQLRGRLRWNVEKKLPVEMELCAPATLRLTERFCNIPAAVSNASHAGASLQQDRPLFAGLTKFKIETQGGVTILKSPLTDEPAVRQNVLYLAPLIVHELKLKVGETVTLAPDALKQQANPLRNPVVRFNAKADVAEAKVIQKEGEVFGAIEFTGKTAGETIILIDYDMFSDIAQVVLSQTRLQVNVKVEQ